MLAAIRRGPGWHTTCWYHPQTQGKIERWRQTLKNRILLDNYYLPGDLERQIAEMKELERWVKIFNKGYAGVFNYETAEDKAIVELSTTREWCRSVAAEFGVIACEPEHNPQDPPDCFVRIKEQRLSVELVQLVEAKHKARAAKNETPYAGQLFLDMQWSKERFADKLRECVQKKGVKYAQTGLRIDVLIVHTDEAWLTSAQARD